MRTERPPRSGVGAYAGFDVVQGKQPGSARPLFLIQVSAVPVLPVLLHFAPMPLWTSPSDSRGQTQCSMRTIASTSATAAKAQHARQPPWSRTLVIQGQPQRERQSSTAGSAPAAPAGPASAEVSPARKLLNAASGRSEVGSKPASTRRSRVQGFAGAAPSSFVSFTGRTLAASLLPVRMAPVRNRGSTAVSDSASWTVHRARLDARTALRSATRTEGMTPPSRSSTPSALPPARPIAPHAALLSCLTCSPSMAPAPASRAAMSRHEAIWTVAAAANSTATRAIRRGCTGPSRRDIPVVQSRRRQRAVRGALTADVRGWQLVTR